MRIPGPAQVSRCRPATARFDSASEDLVAALPELGPGEHAIGFRARDAAGNWSPAALLPISVPSPPLPPPAMSPSTGVAPASTVATLPLVNVSLTRVATRRLRERPPRLEPAQRRRHRTSRGGDLGPARAAGAHQRTRPRVRRAPPRARGRARGTCIRSPRGHRGDCRCVDRDRRDRHRRRRVAGSRRATRRQSRASAGARRCDAAPAESSFTRAPQTITRRPVTIALALDPEQAVLSIDGRQRASLRRGADRAAAAAITLGLERTTSSRAAGFLDIDNVTVRSAPDQT